MPMLEFLTRRTDAPVQKPGRHSTVGLVDRLTRELAELRESRDKEVRGYQDALQRAANQVQENAKYRAWFKRADAGWQAADAEVKRLRQILNERAPVQETVPQAAAADLEGSCFTQPAPPTPERDQDQLSPIALSLPRPETYDVADVTAETQPIKQLAVDETQAMSVAEVRNATGNADTRTDLPVVQPVTPVVPVPSDEPLPPVTWGRARDAENAAIEAHLNTPAPTPEYAATAVPPGIAELGEPVLSEAS